MSGENYNLNSVVVSINHITDTSTGHVSPDMVSASPDPAGTSSKAVAQMTDSSPCEENTAAHTAGPNATSAAPELNASPSPFTKYTANHPSPSQRGAHSVLPQNSAAAYPVHTLAMDSSHAIENAGFASDDHHDNSGLVVLDASYSGRQGCLVTTPSSANGTFVVTHQPVPLKDSFGTPRLSYDELSCTFGAAVAALFLGGCPWSLCALYFSWRASKQAYEGDYTGARWSLKVSVSMIMAAFFTTLLVAVIILLQFSLI